MYIDSHAHLDSPKLAAEREAILLNAHASGIVGILTIGNGDGPADIGCALKIAHEVARRRALGERIPQVWASAGVHPHEAMMVDEAARTMMRAVAADHEVIAWGEIGLDYHYDHSPRKVQQGIFEEQLALAAGFNLPVIIHCRPSDGKTDAFDDLFAALQQHWRGRRGILHCFTGGVAEARKALDLGFMLSFAGNVSFPKMSQIRDAAGSVPDDAFLIETDSPYLAPVPHRGRMNQPAFIPETARHIGELRGVSGEAVGEQAAENFRRFFRDYERTRNI